MRISRSRTLTPLATPLMPPLLCLLNNLTTVLENGATNRATQVLFVCGAKLNQYSVDMPVGGRFAVFDAHRLHIGTSHRTVSGVTSGMRTASSG